MIGSVRTMFGGSPDPGPLAVDEALYIVRNDRRRWAVDVVRGARSPVHLNEIIDEIVALEDADGDRKTVENRVYVSLVQSHIPLLLENGVLEKVDEREYQPGPAFDQIRTIVDRARNVSNGGGRVA